MKEKGKPSNQETLEIQVTRLKECLKESGLSQREIAEKLNYTEQHISYVFNGKRRLTKELAINLAELFSVGRKRSLYFSMPFTELSKEEKELIKAEEQKAGNKCIDLWEIDNLMDDVPFFMEMPNNIDYRYLLGESDVKDIEALKKRKDKTHNEEKAICKMLQLILERSGYILSGDYFWAYSEMIKAIENGSDLPFFNTHNQNIKLTKKDSGESYTLKPIELCFFYAECEKLLSSLAASLFQRLKIESQLSKNRKSKNNINIPKSVLSDLPDTKTLQDLMPENRPKKDPNGTKVDKVR